jgi:hypothetical protein
MNGSEITEAVVSYYQRSLTRERNPEAMRWLERRGINDPEAIARFRIGFADRSLGPLLPPPDLKPGKILRQKLSDIGLYRADSGHEHFRGCVVFPIISSDDITEIYGRKIRDDMRHRVGRHLYLPGPHRGFWNAGVLRETKEIIVCEAIIDALTFWIHGFHNVIAAYGVNGFTDEMFEAVKACGIERALIAFDRDEAGDKGATGLAARLAPEGVACYRVLFPRMMDANDYAKKVQPAAQSLALTLRSAEYMSGPKRASSIVSPGPVPPAVAPQIKIAVETAALPPLDAAVADEPATETEEAEEELPPLAAGPVEHHEPSPARAPQQHTDVSDIVMTLGDRQYRIRGLEKNLSYAQLKVVLRVSRGELFYLDQIDLVSARARLGFVKQAAIDIGVKAEVVKYDLAAVYRELERLQEDLIRQTLAPKESRPAISDRETAAAMKLLTDPDLLQRMLGDFERCGVVGERTNKLVAFLAAVSRLLENPLAIIIQSSSAAGKTKLMDAVLDFIPDEERVRYSAMTGQSLFYFEGRNLKHKILAISEEEGAERASYALKLLQSEGKLTIASTGKNPQTGRLETQEYHVEGPVMIFLTTTSVEIDEELLNRCIVLTVDEERAQTRAIHELQRQGETLAGLLAREEREEILALWRNAQRLLRPMRVVNDHAKDLKFPDGSTRMRRDHTKYLALIRSIALLFQKQRPVRTYSHRGRTIEYIEVIPSDIALANELANEVLGRSLDELAPQTRRLLDLLDESVKRECAMRAVQRCDYRFFQRDVRTWTGWPDHQVKLHLRKLLEMEYLLLHRGGRGQSFVYELLYDGRGKDGKPFLMGLIHDAATQKRESETSEWDSQTGEWKRSGTVQEDIGERGGTSAPIGENERRRAAFPKLVFKKLQNAHRDGNGKDASYSLRRVALLHHRRRSFER